MKKYYLFFLLLVCFLGSVSSQENRIDGVVVDSKTMQPLPLVNISKSVGQQGTSSNESGKFYISVSINDSLFFSAVGYKRQYVTVAKVLESNGIVKLDEEIQVLSELVVKSNRKVKSESQILGYHKSKKRSSFVMRTSGSQIAVFIENKLKREGIFETLYLRLRCTGSFKFQVRVFDKTLEGLPGRDLLRENLVISLKRFDGIFSIDLSSKNIVFPSNGAFICLQTVDNQSRKPSDDGSKPIFENSTFLSSGDEEFSTFHGFRDRYWIREHLSPFRRGEHSNAMFGAKVRFYQLEQ